MALELVPEPDDEVLRLRKAVEMIAVDLANAEAELTAKRRIITTLRNQLEASVTEHEDAALAEPAIQYWRDRCNHPRARSGGRRITVVLARLRDDPPHTLEDLRRAIDGAALKPYVGSKGRAATGKASERYDDLLLILKDAEPAERFASYRQAAIVEERFSVVLERLCLPPGVRRLPFSVEEQAWRALCPCCRCRLL
jgi:hypothetical protein